MATPAVHTTQGMHMYCLPHFFVGGGDPTTAPLDHLWPYYVLLGYPRMMIGATTPSCGVSCHSYYNVQHIFL